MIIVRLWGGLGNQMFQYAAGRRLAHVNGDLLKLDVTWFGREARGDTPRRYELAPFAVAAPHATPAEIRRLRGPDIRRWPKVVKRLLEAAGYRGRPSYVRERHFHFDPDIIRLKGDLYLDGFWQSDRYFGDAAEVIRTDFALRAPPTGTNARLLREVEGCESVSLHVRRGDYVTNPNAASHHGTVPLDYYKRGIQVLAFQVSSPHLFVFSDDHRWVMQNMEFPLPTTFVEGNGVEHPAEDMRIMAGCRHHIIANSSFSWWGAWLGQHPGKIVIAPKQWFASRDAVTDDLIPEGWLRL